MIQEYILEENGVENSSDGNDAVIMLVGGGKIPGDRTNAWIHREAYRSNLSQIRGNSFEHRTKIKFVHEM